MSFLALMAERVLNCPLLMAPEKAHVFLEVLHSRLGINAPAADRFEGDEIEWDEDGNFVKSRPFRVTDQGVGIISIVGSLVNRGAYVNARSGLVSYEGIKHQVKTARADDAVKSVLLDIQSFGGEAIGAFETAALVRSLSATKKTVALVNGVAASAAYAIASGASEIVTTPTGKSGSIGVVLMHADLSQKLSKEGVNPTLIFAGQNKVDGNPFGPLPEGVRQQLQLEVNSLYEAFLKNVALGRGDRLTEAMARATGARTYFGEADNPDLDAVKQGLADRVGCFESVLEDLSRAQGGRTTQLTKGLIMSETNSAPVAASTGISTADQNATNSAAETRGREEGAAQERARLTSIMTAEGISGDASRMNHALELATEAPTMSAEKVVQLTTKHLPAAEDSQEPQPTGLSLDDRRTDADPLGEAVGSSSKPTTGLSQLIDAKVSKMAG